MERTLEVYRRIYAYMLLRVREKFRQESMAQLKFVDIGLIFIKYKKLNVIYYYETPNGKLFNGEMDFPLNILSKISDKAPDVIQKTITFTNGTSEPLRLHEEIKAVLPQLISEAVKDDFIVEKTINEMTDEFNKGHSITMRNSDSMVIAFYSDGCIVEQLLSKYLKEKSGKIGELDYQVQYKWSY